MINRKLSGAEKAAILLLSLGDDIASKIFQNLDEKEIQILSNYMGHLDNISTDVIESVREEFVNAVSGGENGIVSGGKEYLKKVLSKVLDPKKVTDILHNLTLPGGEVKGGLDALKMADPKTVANFLKNEHPQTSAIILSHLEPNHAASILSEMEDSLKGEVVLRIATLDRISPAVIKELDDALYEEFKSAAAESSRIGGINAVAEILNQMDHTSEGLIISEIESNDPDLANNIRQLMFVFEDILKVDDRGIQAILKEVSSEELLLSLKTASEELKEKVFKNMSERAAIMAREDLEAMGPKRLSEVEKAQQGIIKVAKRLEEEGKIVIGGAGEELV